MSELATNVPEYTVSEISGAVKRTLESAFGRVRVRGELTDVKRYPSGHIYFSMKDEGATFGGVVWRSAVARLGLVPENGVEVIATGRITAFNGKLQFSVETMAYAGVGAMLARIEMLRVRLTAEGLFDIATKRHLPMLPGIIGVVTSAQGAVLQDIRTTLARRFPRPLLVWPVPVQGEGAADRIAAAIQGFDRLPSGDVPRPDVLIVARGGGSLEDLMAFNDEGVVRAAALCRIPLISAVGHETDHTLIDLAADRRAPTPTAAAELAVPARDAMVALIDAERTRLHAGLQRQMQEQRLRLSRAERGLPDPHVLMAARAARLHRAAVALPDLPGLARAARLALDGRADRLRLAAPNLVRARRAGLVQIERGLPDPQMLMAVRATRLDHAAAGLPDLPALVIASRLALGGRTGRMRLALPNLVRVRRTELMQAERGIPSPRALTARPEGRLRLAHVQLGAALRHTTQRRRADGLRITARLSPPTLAAALREQRARLNGLGGRLDGVSPLAVLSRGYAIVTGADGHALTTANAARAGQAITIRFGDGAVAATVGGVRQGRLAV